MVLNVHYIALGKFDFEIWVHFFDNYVSTKVMKCNQNKFDFLSFLGIVAQLQIIDGFCCQIFGFQPPETHFNLRKWQIKKYLGHRTTLHWLARGWGELTSFSWLLNWSEVCWSTELGSLVGFLSFYCWSQPGWIILSNHDFASTWSQWRTMGQDCRKCKETPSHSECYRFWIFWF